MTATTVNTKGIELQVGNGATPTETFTACAQIVDISEAPGGATTKSIDVTTLDDTFSQKDGGATLDAGSVKFEVLYDPANTQHQALKDGVGTRKNFKNVLPDGTEYAYSGVITEFKVMSKKDDKVRASVSIDISGEVTETV
ncbi:MAG TPA: phage tail tube protein [Fluviicoccus sp.]|nr:phage tail tube protein [Fluviicoccus sp.]